jgi:hypothetical protein
MVTTLSNAKSSDDVSDLLSDNGAPTVSTQLSILITNCRRSSVTMIVNGNESFSDKSYWP